MTSAKEMRVFLPDEEATQQLAQRLAAHLPARAVVYLHGDLGAGKSTLARAMLRALGVSGAIKSPTYTLIERYPSEQGELAHLDLYRIGDPEELGFLGLDELHASARLWLIEWPERGQGGLPVCDLRVELAVESAGRNATLTATSDVGQRWLASI
ncbi:MAG: tRNA (adenosine(37)-N6)-threonylcarbamoyltransferase complex ATPase subunit type 1 TsaE [Lysobacteraceae bacterium]